MIIDLEIINVNLFILNIKIFLYLEMTWNIIIIIIIISDIAKYRKIFSNIFSDRNDEK